MRYIRGSHSLCATLALLGDDHVILRGSQVTRKSRPSPNTLTSSALHQCLKQLYELEKYLSVHITVIIVMS